MFVDADLALTFVFGCVVLFALFVLDIVVLDPRLDTFFDVVCCCNTPARAVTVVELPSCCRDILLESRTAASAICKPIKQAVIKNKIFFIFILYIISNKALSGQGLIYLIKNKTAIFCG